MPNWLDKELRNRDTAHDCSEAVTKEHVRSRESHKSMYKYEGGVPEVVKDHVAHVIQSANTRPSKKREKALYSKESGDTFRIYTEQNHWTGD